MALAPDLVSGAGGTDKVTDPAQVSALLGQTAPEQLVSMPHLADRLVRIRRKVQYEPGHHVVE